MLERRKHQAKKAFGKVGPGIDKSNKHPSPISLRLTHDERAQLSRDAGDRTLSSYIRERLFDESASTAFKRPAKKQNRPSVDRVALAKLLGALGQSRLSSNMNQIAKAVHMGALPVSDDLERELEMACADIKEMRNTLMKALGRR